MEEVRKLALKIECLSVKFQLFYKELEHIQECETQRRLFDGELRRRQTPCYDFIRILVIILICFIFKNFFKVILICSMF